MGFPRPKEKDELEENKDLSREAFREDDAGGAGKLK
jgi:hypothetical protein